MDIKFIEPTQKIQDKAPYTMTEKFMARFPRLVPTKERANILLFIFAIVMFILALTIIFITAASNERHLPPPGVLR